MAQNETKKHSAYVKKLFIELENQFKKYPFILTSDVARKHYPDVMEVNKLKKVGTVEYMSWFDAGSIKGGSTHHTIDEYGIRIAIFEFKNHSNKSVAQHKFTGINNQSGIGGKASEMVKKVLTVLNNFKVRDVYVEDDWSEGFWEYQAEIHSKFNWHISEGY